MVTEMHGYVSYMEEMKRFGGKELGPHRDRLRELAKRLSVLAGESEGKNSES
jgi:hypothetical protein